MAKLNAAERKALPKKVFGLPDRAPGSGSYPMPDKQHAALAVGYSKRDASPAEQKRIRAKAHRLYPGMRSASDPSQMHSLSSMARC